jgi:hypothetical protein
VIPEKIRKDFEDNVLSVQQLIDELQKIPDKTRKVVFHYKEGAEVFYISFVAEGRTWVRPMTNEIVWFDVEDTEERDLYLREAHERPDFRDTKVVVALVEDTVYAGHAYCSCCDKILSEDDEG